MIGSDFVQQLRGPWESAQGFLITQMELWQAALAKVFTLMEGITTRVDQGATLGPNDFPVSSILTTISDGTTGFSQMLPCPIAFLPSTIITPPALTANVNNYTPTNIGIASILRVSGAAVNITGLLAPPISVLRVVTNVGANTITLTHQDTASAAQNRFTCPGAANFLLTTKNTVWIWYDLTAATWQVW